MGLTAIIGGSGFASLPGFDIDEARAVSTAFGAPSARLVRGRLAGRELLFLPRHGVEHGVPPHRINFRANVQALYDAGADRVVGLAAVGGIGADLPPLRLCVPDQIVDYTFGREHTFHRGGGGAVVHVDFSHPYSASLRRLLLGAAVEAGVDVRDGGTYGATQGPRLETCAEIRRLQRDGCDMVGMTAMPEAALARERGLSYATLAFVVNWAAGKTEAEITMDRIHANLEHCADSVLRILHGLAART